MWNTNSGAEAGKKLLYFEIHNDTLLKIVEWTGKIRFLRSFIEKDIPVALLNTLLEKPAVLSAASKYTTFNGIFYMACGALVFAWPGAIQTIFRDPGFAGHEEALFRLLGMLLVIVGWFAFFGGRSGAKQIVAASVVDRVTLAPLVLASLAMAGVFTHVMTTFAILDPTLGIGAWLLLGRKS
ncbi:MAG: hypothetical protein ACLPGW_08720 [Roseiarcus sp.]